jgi:phosphatidylglycerophosphate synthase
MNERRVLILADESADWIVAGLRQLDRLALAIDEFAIQSTNAGPVTVCIFWAAAIDHSKRWTPTHPRLTHVYFASEPTEGGWDLILTTHLFVYRKAIARLLEQVGPQSFGAGRTWDECLEVTQTLPKYREAGWERLDHENEIAAAEKRFLRSSGKSQDGLVSRCLNRPLSREVTRLLLPTSVTPNLWTWLLSPVPLLATLVMAHGTYWSFVWGLVLFQVFSILDGCDGEIARARFMESEQGRRLDDFFDVLSNILLVLGVGFGLYHAHPHAGRIFLIEGIAAAVLIGVNEWLLAGASAAGAGNDSLGGTLYPRHRAMVERSGLLAFGERFASMLIQLTKRDVAVLFFVVLALAGVPSLILHLLLLVTAVSLVLALRAR